ncbi:hypothetical protein B0T17DRAFT_507946 [Bombardia bombarda]|uniref:Uncharacterized protein n=1 Tax=Bombardia bombarda TaxID=252184 RepID=A0AA39X0U3_9PEZI|nr:hypothetical protein B0T17DRAFT_507946 [Bombardia bombarda]
MSQKRMSGPVGSRQRPPDPAVLAARFPSSSTSTMMQQTLPPSLNLQMNESSMSVEMTEPGRSQRVPVRLREDGISGAESDWKLRTWERLSQEWPLKASSCRANKELLPGRGALGRVAASPTWAVGSSGDGRRKIGGPRTAAARWRDHEVWGISVELEKEEKILRGKSASGGLGRRVYDETGEKGG